MLTYKDIMTAVNNKLKEKFGDIVESDDIEEGIKRPSFFVEIDNIKTKNFMQIGKDRNITIYIYYFPTNKHKSQIELLDIRHELENLFLYDAEIWVLNYNVPINELSIDIVENKGQKKVLMCKFDLDFYEYWNKPDEYEKMENLVYDEK